MSLGKGINRVSNLGLGYHVFWVIFSALLLAYTLIDWSSDSSSVVEMLVDGAVGVLWMAVLAQEIAIVAQGRYRKPVPPVPLVKKATAEDVR